MRTIDRRLARLEETAPPARTDPTRPALASMSLDDLRLLRSLVAGRQADPGYQPTTGELKAQQRYEQCYRRIEHNDR